MMSVAQAYAVVSSVSLLSKPLTNAIYGDVAQSLLFLTRVVVDCLNWQQVHLHIFLDKDDFQLQLQDVACLSILN